MGTTKEDLDVIYKSDDKLISFSLGKDAENLILTKEKSILVIQTIDGRPIFEWQSEETILSSAVQIKKTVYLLTGPKKMVRLDITDKSDFPKKKVIKLPCEIFSLFCFNDHLFLVTKQANVVEWSPEIQNNWNEENEKKNKVQMGDKGEVKKVQMIFNPQFSSYSLLLFVLKDMEYRCLRYDSNFASSSKQPSFFFKSQPSGCFDKLNLQSLEGDFSLLHFLDDNQHIFIKKDQEEYVIELNRLRLEPAERINLMRLPGSSAPLSVISSASSSFPFPLQNLIHIFILTKDFVYRFNHFYSPSFFDSLINRTKTMLTKDLGNKDQLIFHALLEEENKKEFELKLKGWIRSNNTPLLVVEQPEFDFFSFKIFEKIIKRNWDLCHLVECFPLIPEKTCSQIVQHFIKTNNVEKLLNSSHLVSCLSPDDASKLISFLLSSSSSHPESKSSQTSLLVQLLTKLVSCSDNNLSRLCQHINFSDVQKLLQTLNCQFKMLACPNEYNCEEGFSVLNLEVAVKWTSWLVDNYYNRLLISAKEPNSNDRHLILSLQTLINELNADSSVNLYNLCGSFPGSFRLKRKKSNFNQQNGSYYVQTMII